MAEQLSIFAKPKAACESGPIRYAVKTADLDGKTIKEQLTRLVHVSCGEAGLIWTAFSQAVIGLDGQMVFDVRDNWIDCPPELSAKICEVFSLPAFPINPAPMDRPVLPDPWYINMMKRPEAPDSVLNAPRDEFILLGDSNPYLPNPRLFKLGPFQTWDIPFLPLADRAVVSAFMIANPGLSHFLDVMRGYEGKPRKQMSEEAKRGIRLLNLMRRCVKKYGMLAEEFARAEVDERGLEWSDATWERANLPPKASNVKAKRQARRKSDNDELLSGAK